MFFLIVDLNSHEATYVYVLPLHSNLSFVIIPFANPWTECKECDQSTKIMEVVMPYSGSHSMNEAATYFNILDRVLHGLHRCSRCMIPPSNKAMATCICNKPWQTHWVRYLVHVLRFLVKVGDPFRFGVLRLSKDESTFEHCCRSVNWEYQFSVTVAWWKKVHIISCPFNKCTQRLNIS